jgi:hypothetical protein
MRLKRGLVVAALAAVIAFAVSGCGDSDGGAQKASPATETTATAVSDPVSTDSSARGVIQEVVDDVQDGLSAADGWGVCTEVTMAEEARLTRSARQGEHCTTAISRTLAGYKRDGVERVRTKVESVDVNKARAVATVRDGDGETYEVLLVLDGGTWKLPKVDLARPSGLVPR